MQRRRVAVSVVLAVGLAASCKGAAPAPEPVASAESPASAEPDEPEPSAHAEARPKAPASFALPFAWEASADEPMARTRGFLSSVLADNGKYVSDHKPSFFEAFRSKQKPRATVVLCSDSRVQSTGYDATPENDVFTIRDIGNQIATAAGSVEYGVRHLHTNVLMIVGHTGCGAVKAALGDSSSLEEPIRREVGTLVVRDQPAGEDPEAAHGESGHAAAPAKSAAPKASAAPSAEPAHGEPKAPAAREDSVVSVPRGWMAPGLDEEDRVWLAGVLANVNHQVSDALGTFAAEIGRGDLTVVGAVFDFRNDMGRGYGRLVIVNVNGNRDPARVASFTRALGSSDGASSKSAEVEHKGEELPKGVARAIETLVAERGHGH